MCEFMQGNECGLDMCVEPYGEGSKDTLDH